MSQKVLVLIGLPASGKSTFAKKLVSGDIYAMGKNWKRINKDDLRAMLDNSHWNKTNENFVLKARDFLINQALLGGFNVVVDDTNFNPSHIQAIKGMVDAYNKSQNQHANFSTMYFDTPLDICIIRNKKRTPNVPEVAIHDMYNRYIKDQPPIKADVVQKFKLHEEKIPPVYVPPIGKPKAILVDIDGTLAHMTPEGRLRFGKQAPFMWEYVHEDAVDPVVSTLVRDYHNKAHADLMNDDEPAQVIIMSGRDSGCRDVTEKWLQDNHIPYDALFMRAAGDNRKDNIVKRELFDAHIRDNYQVEFVLDDRDQVVEMWRNELGLKVLQVAEGKF